MNIFSNGQLGFDLFNDAMGDDFVPLVKTGDKNEKKRGTKETDRKKQKQHGKSTAKSIMLTFPVTCYGRNFTCHIEGSGETNLQSVIEAVYAEGYTEVSHIRLSFWKINDHCISINYGDLSASEELNKVNLPVKVVDGMKCVEYTENTDFDLDENDSISVSDLIRKGLNDTVYDDCWLDYDITTGLALPIFDTIPLGQKSPVTTGDPIIVCGKHWVVTNQTTIFQEALGELPQNADVLISKSANNAYFFHLRPVSGDNHDSVIVDRSSFNIIEEAKPEKTEEKISLPVDVFFSNFGQTLSITPEDFGASKVTWNELLELLKARIRILKSTDRKIDHYYDSPNNRLSIALFSGKKGCMSIRNHCFSYSAEDHKFTIKERIPKEILEKILAYFTESIPREAVVQIWYDHQGYEIVKPCIQHASDIYINYSFPVRSEGSLIMSIHSHNTMPAFWSPTDDADELDLPGLYGVIGRLQIDDKNHYCYNALFRFTRGKEYPPVTIKLEDLFA